MRILPIPATAPVLVVDDFYSEDELNLLWKEIKFLTEADKFNPPESTGAAQEGEEYLKSANGIWIDNLYTNRSTSNILRCNRKIFTEEFTTAAKSTNPLYCILESINSDYTLLNYYEDSEYYKKHRDESVFTAITMLIKDPSKFSGGDFIVHDFDMLIEKRNNRLVLFPGVLEHSVTPVKMNEPYTAFNGDGRYTITQFMNVK